MENRGVIRVIRVKPLPTAQMKWKSLWLENDSRDPYDSLEGKTPMKEDSMMESKVVHCRCGIGPLMLVRTEHL